MRLHIEVEHESQERTVASGGAELAAFMSFANLRGFGATHPLIALADRLSAHHHIAVGPLTIFYGHDSEDAEDREKLEYAWQDAQTLSETLAGTLTALDADEQTQSLLRRAEAPSLRQDLAELYTISTDAAAQARRVRLSFSE